MPTMHDRGTTFRPCPLRPAAVAARFDVCSGPIPGYLSTYNYYDTSPAGDPRYRQ